MARRRASNPSNQSARDYFFRFLDWLGDLSVPWFCLLLITVTFLTNWVSSQYRGNRSLLSLVPGYLAYARRNFPVDVPLSTGVELSLRLSGIKDTFDDLWVGYTTAVNVVSENEVSALPKIRVRTWFQTSSEKTFLYSWVAKATKSGHLLKFFNIITNIQFDERVWDEEKEDWGKGGKKGVVGGVWREWIGDDDAIEEGLESAGNGPIGGKVLTSADSYTPAEITYSGPSCYITPLPQTVSSYPTEFLVGTSSHSSSSTSYTVFEVGLDKWAFTSEEAVFNIVHASPGVHLSRCYVFETGGGPLTGREELHPKFELPTYISDQVKITIQSPSYYQSTVSPSDIVMRKVSPWMNVIGDGMGSSEEGEHHFFGSVTSYGQAMVRCGFTSMTTHAMYNGVEATVQRMSSKEGEKGGGKMQATCGMYNEIGRRERELYEGGGGDAEDEQVGAIDAVVVGIEQDGWILPTGSWGGGSGYLDATRLVTSGEEWLARAKSTSDWGVEKIIAIQQGLGENTKYQFGAKYGQIIGPEVGATIQGGSVKGVGIPVFYYFPFITEREWLADSQTTVKGSIGLQMIVTLPECEGAGGEAQKTKNNGKKGNQDKVPLQSPTIGKGTVDLKPNACGGMSGDKIVNLSTDRGKVVLYNVPSGVTGVRFRLVDGVGQSLLVKSRTVGQNGFKWNDILAQTHFNFKNNTSGVQSSVPKDGSASTGRGGGGSIFELLNEGVSLASLELLIAREPERAREKDSRGRSVVQAARELGREDVVEFFIEEGLEE
ncbi:hypothetical protein TrRE_jg8878 [Triparma retinervis]|uniref:Uncharacterized protein n=1 Tax=Triparma retinervis TaxID=2557542 RepID=A0A9W6ZQS4_9STRA|nr:hypothetical protein TrRE_jg8878 [Triparma retinervis]